MYHRKCYINVKQFKKCNWLMGCLQLMVLAHVFSFWLCGWRCIPEERCWACQELDRPCFTSQQHDSALNLESLLLGSLVYYVTNGQSHRCNSGSPQWKSESSCSWTFIISVINEHVQSTHCVSLETDYINHALNFNGQVLSLSRTWRC